MKSHSYIGLILVGILSYGLRAQSLERGVELKAKTNGKEILLRWAPTSPLSWKLANDYGYTLERITLLENGKVLVKPKYELLGVIKPAPLPDWEEFAINDDYVAVAAQSIYGQDFNVTETYSSDLVKVVNQSRVIENKFSFALYSADMSLIAASLSGLFYRDEEVYSDFEYLYRIYPNIPPEVLSVDTASVLIGLQDVVELPVIEDFEVHWGDQLVELSWGEYWKSDYSGYWIEKSVDGRQFSPVNKVPIVSTAQENQQGLVSYDSLDDNTTKYYYRIYGADYFGERGPFSAVVSGSGRAALNHSPVIKQAVETAGGIKLSWELAPEGSAMVSSFDLLRQLPQIDQLEIVQEGIDSDLREVVDRNPKSSNYYVISAKDRYGREARSFPFFFQKEDSIPPGPPENLSGRIDTLGRVHLRWDHNKESDLHGYQLYVSNFPDTEFIQVAGPVISDNQFVHQVDLETLNEKIYYKLKALDSRFNPSKPSETLKLKKPDRIPPLPPVFADVRSDTLGIHLVWKPSPSKDVIRYYLYRKSEAEKDWALVEQFVSADSIYTYLDKEVKGGLTYGYTFIAVDDDQLESRPAVPVKASALLLPDKIFSGLFSAVDVENKIVSLSWQASRNDILSFLIYKGKNGEALSLFREIDGSIHELKDQFDLSDEYVEYQLLATLDDGQKSRFSRKIRIAL